MLILYAYPQDEFYPAVLLRTVYVASGLENIEFYIVPGKKLNLGDIVRYSRVPAELFKERVKLVYEVDRAVNLLRRDKVRKIVLLTSTPPASGEVREFDRSLMLDVNPDELALVVDELGILSTEIYASDDLRNKLLCVKTRSEYGRFAYDAVALVYDLLIRKLPEKKLVEEVLNQPTPDVDLSELFYLMSRVLEACKLVDNFLVVSPRTLVYTLRHVFLKHGLLLDLRETKLMFDHVRGRCRQEVIVEVYRARTLEYLGSYTCVLEGNLLEVPYVDRQGNILTLRLLIDYDRGRVYLNRSVVYEARRPEHEVATIESFAAFLSL